MPLLTIEDGNSAPQQIPVMGTTFWSETTTALGSGATFTGTSRDVGVAPGTQQSYAYFNAAFFADQAGAGYIDASNDGTSWTTIATANLSASLAAILSVPVMFRYHRTRLVNGSSAQTACVVNSAYQGS